MCMILPQEHNQLYLSEETLLTQGFFVPEHFSLGATADNNYIAGSAILNNN